MIDDLPIIYIKNFIKNPNEVFDSLWNELNWTRIDKVPRREYYSNEHPFEYTYGSGEFARTYKPQSYHHKMIDMQNQLNEYCGIHLAFSEKVFDVCFLNGYENSKDQLGWHADDSVEMDHKRPIAIISLGAEREIWFKLKDKDNASENVHKQLLNNGSLCLMKPGMQLTHFHRIPKCADQDIGPRISLTFRGFVI